MSRFRAVLAVVTALLLGGAVTPLRAQGSEDAIDRVVAVVGLTPILRSQIDEKLFQMQNDPRLAGTVPTDPAALTAFRRALVDSLIARELLFQEAIKDTMIKVTDQEVAEAADQQIRVMRRDMPSAVDFNRELRTAGFASQDEFRVWLMEEQRREFYVQRYRQQLEQNGDLKPLAPTQKEIRAFYDRAKAADRLPPMPATISIKQLIVVPKPTPEAKERMRLRADSIAQELRKGGDFAQAARRFSMDPVSAANGGDLNWFRRGQMVRAFEDVAFTLKPGVISHPVESSFGYHLIQVQRVQPTEVMARHILLTPEIDSTGAGAAKVRIDDIRAALVRGANFDSLVRLYHDPAEDRESEGIPVDSLPPAYAAALSGVDSGQVSPVFALTDGGDPLRTKYAVAKVTSRTPAGVVTFESVKERIRTILGKQLAERAYIDGLRRRTYVDVREP